MKFFACLLTLVLMSVTAYAADVDGKWTGTVDAPQGPVPVTFNFKADDAKLTGSTTSPDAGELEIKDGMIDGNAIAFTVTFDFGGMPFVLPYKGIVSSDQIKMSADVFGMPLEFVLKKAKDVAALDGTWAGSIPGPQGEFPVSFTFKADGTKLTGSTMGPDGTDVQIKDGKIDGNTISFTVTFDLGMPFMLSYKGVLGTDQIKMSGDAFGMPFEFVLKKTK